MMAQNERFGGAQNDVPTCMTLTPSGEIILAGYNKSFDDGSDQVFVMKLNDNGELIWDQTYGNIYGDRPYDICMSDEHIILTGETWLGFGNEWGRENMFAIELDASGDLLTQQSYYQYHRDMGLRIHRLSNGSYISIGFTKSAEDAFGEILVTKLDAFLNILWQSTIGVERSIDYGFDIISNNEGFLAIGSQVGFFNSNQVDFLTPQYYILIAQVVFFGNLLWKKIYGGAGHEWVEKAVVINNEIY